MKTGRTLLRICVYVGSVVAGSSPVGYVFVVNNLDSIRDKTIPAGQNADFGGFLRSKAVSTGRFSSSAIKCRRCRRRSVPARSGAAQFALRAPPPTGNQSAAPVVFIFLPSIRISSVIKRFQPDKMLILVVSSGQRPFLPDVFWFGARSLVFSSVAPQWHVCRRKVRCRSSFPAELGPFSQGRGRPCLSIGTRATGSLLH